jgi:protein required for attachment to host cells
MTFSIPKNALVVITDGEHAFFYLNKSSSGIKLEKKDELSQGIEDGLGAAPVPHETSKHEYREAKFAKHIANDLYKRVHAGGVDAIVLVADPQTLGQIRPSLHKEVTDRITGELNKTLIKSSLTDIERLLSEAAT